MTSRDEGTPMAGATPEETFSLARAAMERGDWEGVFACLDAGNLKTIGDNSIGRFVAGGEAAADAFVALCGEHGVPREPVAALHSSLQQMAESMRAARASTPDPATMMERSRLHQQTVAAYRDAVKSILKSAPDLPRFIAALERAIGGGSVSARLFVGEVVDDVQINGTKAWGVRRGPNGFREDVGFVRKKGLWYVRLFGTRPK
jgi:hypothetical protein